MRRITSLLVAALAGGAVLGAPASAAPVPPSAPPIEAPIGGERLAARGYVVADGAPALPSTSAAGWLVADLDTGEVLAAKDPHGRYAPASTMKMLTAHTLIPRLDPELLVTPVWEDVAVEGSRVGIVQTMTYSVKDLLTAMLVVSGNDAAHALATANGGMPATVKQMNAEARRLQAMDTRAYNTSGLDHPRQLSSPYDLALIAREAMRSDAFRGYVATKRYDFPAPRKKTIYLASHDKLLWNYDGAIGIKNGYTTKARATFVGAATRGGRTLVVTLMKTNPRYWPEAAALLDWGFKASKRGVAPVGQLVDPVPPPPLKTSTMTAPQPLNADVNAASAGKGERLPILSTLLVTAGVMLLAGALLRGRAVRRRRRRHRSRVAHRSRLDLPR